MEKQDVSQVSRRIRALMKERKYKEVVKVADGLNLNRINNGLLILDIVEAYEKLGDKKAAKSALLNYYDVHGITGRNMMQKLIELCIETRDIANAVGLCMEFENEWPESSISYLMRYQITTSAGGNLEERIYYLEKYKEAEFEERWGYELAKLYDKNNQKEKCAEICHEIICFFGTGKYVEKAVQLKEKTIGLTEDEIKIVETARRREEEARVRREEEERQAREEMARLAEEEARRVKEEEEKRRQEEELRHREEEEYRQKEEERQRQIAEERARQQRQADEEKEYRRRKEEEDGQYWSWSQITSGDKNTKRIDDSGDIRDETTRKARLAENEKIRQTEEAARLLKEKREAEKNAREEKIAQALKTSDRYAQVERNRSETIYFDEIVRTAEDSGTKRTQKKNSQENGGILSSFGRMASNVKKTLQADDDYMETVDSSAEIEYITVGRDTQAYAEDVEERMLSELDMLDDEQIEGLTSTQIKEIYELKILHDVRESITRLVNDASSMYQTETSQQELERFVDTEPYISPLELAEESPDAIATGKKEAKEESEETAEPVKSMKSEEIAESTEKVNDTESISQVVSQEYEDVSELAENAEHREKVAPEENTEGKNTEKKIAEEEIAEEEIAEVKENAVLEENQEPEEHAEFRKTMESTSEAECGEETESEVLKETEAAMTSENSAEPEANKESKDVQKTAEETGKETILDRITDPNISLSMTEFSECVSAYAQIQGYQIEETAYMTIAVLAEEMQQKNIALSMNNAKIMADEAIKRIQKRNPLDKIRDKYSTKHAHLLKDKHFYWNN